MSGEEDDVPSAEILMLSISECFIYKVPPLRSASGHRAEDWGLANPLYTGCLQIFQCDTKLRIVLYAYKDPTHLVMDSEHIQFIGNCPIGIQYGESIVNYVDAVIDSSRYYVLRIKDPKSSRTMLLGVGFRDREQAFDFKNCLNEYIKYIDRMHLATMLKTGAHHHTAQDSNTSSSKSNKQQQEEEEELDGYLSMKGPEQHNHKAEEAVLLHLDEHITPLKEGEKIHVKLNVNKKPSATPETSSSKTASSKGGFSLKPPPPAGSTVFVSVPSTNPQATSAANATEDEDWGDFTSS